MATRIHHINAGVLHAPPNPRASCHCLLLEDRGRLALVDTGIGLLDCADPVARIGATMIELGGFQFGEADTAVRQIEKLGFRPADVTDVVLTHGDPDHAGGLADFSQARVHVAAEERQSINGGHWRYRPEQFRHAPRWVEHTRGRGEWFGLEARPLHLGFDSEVLLIPLFGHTPGHCGVAVRSGAGWLLHVGDAYFLRAELTVDEHPVSALAAMRADNDELRRATLAELRRLANDHAGEIEMFGYHDFGEFPIGFLGGGRDS